MQNVPFYDPTKSYDENYDQGPYGAFANGETLSQSGEPEYDFLGQKVYLPLGIAPGPLINSNFCKAAFQKGFDIAVYKTVRSNFHPSHPFPHVLSVKVDGDLTFKQAEEGVVADTDYQQLRSITNSFGVPSKEPAVWQEDVRKAISYADKGQVLVLSFMGTVRENQLQWEFIEDYALAARLAAEIGVKILEVNLSCPNVGSKERVCYDFEVTEKVCKAVRREIGNIPLIMKVGYYQTDEEIKRIAEIAEKYAQAIANINAIQAKILDKNGNQAFGQGRAISGVCGAAIKWAGLEMVKRHKKIREQLGFSYQIIGIGGVMTPKDFFEYRGAGADVVQSATGAMWNPYLAKEIKEKEKIKEELLGQIAPAAIVGEITLPDPA